MWKGDFHIYMVTFIISDGDWLMVESSEFTVFSSTLYSEILPCISWISSVQTINNHPIYQWYLTKFNSKFDIYGGSSTWLNSMLWIMIFTVIFLELLHNNYIQRGSGYSAKKSVQVPYPLSPILGHCISTLIPISSLFVDVKLMVGSDGLGMGVRSSNRKCVEGLGSWLTWRAVWVIEAEAGGSIAVWVVLATGWHRTLSCKCWEWVEWWISWQHKAW